MPNLLGTYFGRTHYSRIVGWTTPIITLSCAASPVIAGFLYDVTGKYFLSFSLAAVLIFASAIITLLSRPPQLPATIKAPASSPNGNPLGTDKIRYVNSISSVYGRPVRAISQPRNHSKIFFFETVTSKNSKKGAYCNLHLANVDPDFEDRLFFWKGGEQLNKVIKGAAEVLHS